MTKQDDILKISIDETLDTTQIDIISQLTDTTPHICTPPHPNLNTDNIILQQTNYITKPNITTTAKTTQLEQAISELCNIENYAASEKSLNIDLDLYQMEDC